MTEKDIHDHMKDMMEDYKMLKRHLKLMQLIPETKEERLERLRRQKDEDDSRDNNIYI